MKDLLKQIKKKPLASVGILAALILILSALHFLSPQNNPRDEDSNASATESVTEADIPAPLKIFFLDVGQADATLVFLPNDRIMLVDAGNRADGAEIVSCLNSLDITTIDYLVATHPHEDHIGGMKDVVENFTIANIYMPKIADDQLPTTKTYLDLLTAIDEKGLTIKTGAAGVTLEDTETPYGHLDVQFLAPIGEVQNHLNNYSIITRIAFTGSRSSNTQSVLIMGDAEVEVEYALLDADAPLAADILRIGHHGSKTSSYEGFIKAVNPLYTVISCGKDNEYSHPHQVTLDTLSAIGTEVWRTDVSGTVVAELDGEKVTLSKSSLSCDGNPPKLTVSEVMRIFHFVPIY